MNSTGLFSTLAASWAERFQPFSLFHLLTTAGCGAVMAMWCIVGGRIKRTRGDAGEKRFSVVVGSLIIVYQLWFLGRYLLPEHFTWTRSLPLMLCDLAALLAGASLIWGRRWMRTVLYFWAIGLSTQAFFTPILQEGYGTLRYWTFWIGHTAIVGAAIYEIVVRGYRPTWQDWRTATCVSLLYAGVAIATNLVLDRSGLLAVGEMANYGYLGNSTPTNPTLMDKLGPWPGRVGIVAVIVLSLFAVLTLVWGPGRRARADGAGV